MGQRGPVVSAEPLDSGVAGKGLAGAGYNAPRMLPVEGKIMNFWATLSYDKNQN